MDLRLNAFLIQLPYDLLNAAGLIPAGARALSEGDRGGRKDKDGDDNCASHGKFTFVRCVLAWWFLQRTPVELTRRLDFGTSGL
jgi:hypothetical protein